MQPRFLDSSLIGHAALGAVLALTAALAAAGPAAAAASAGDANAAKGLVAEHCVDCHKVPGFKDSGLPTVDAPAFDKIAKQPAKYPEGRLRRFLQEPHWPMEQFRLSPSDIDNVLAFIGSLRAD